MSFYDGADAFYGTGTYGSARYGVVIPSFSITGVAGTSAVGRYFRGVQGTGTVDYVDSALTEPTEVTPAMTGAVGTVIFIASVRITLVSSGLVGHIARPTVTGDEFDFEAVKTLYDRKRLIYVPARPSSAQRTIKVR